MRTPTRIEPKADRITIHCKNQTEYMHLYYWMRENLKTVLNY